LGLSICHRIVRDLGGEITVETGAKRGSTFRVVLPAATATASAPDVTRSDPPESAPRRRRSDPPESAPRRRARILVVDDEPKYANSLRMLLSLDHNVTVVPDGACALSLLS